MNYYKIEFPGVYLGGTCIVAADSEHDALDFLGPLNIADLDELTITPIPVVGRGVLYLDDGDY